MIKEHSPEDSHRTSDSIFERLKSGIPVEPGDPMAGELRKAAFDNIRLLQKLNNSSDPEEIRKILMEITGSDIDRNLTIFPPIHINYGKNLTLGRDVFINFGCTFLTLGGVTIEDNVLIGPKVNVLSENHPLEPSKRKGLIPGKIHLKSNCWIGAGATILPGVTVGQNAVVAAGAVVNRDVPSNSVVGGVPARIIKTLPDQD